MGSSDLKNYYEDEHKKFFIDFIDNCKTSGQQIKDDLEDGFQFRDLKSIGKELLFNKDFREKVYRNLLEIPNAWDHFLELKIREGFEILVYGKEKASELISKDF